MLLDDLDREYTLDEIAIITRAGPARLLGLRDKGHLGVGADADVTIYDDRADREEMFATPRYVIKARRASWSRTASCVERRTGRRCCASPRALRPDAIEHVLEPLFERALHACGSTNYPVSEPWLLEPRAAWCRREPA